VIDRESILGSASKLSYRLRKSINMRKKGHPKYSKIMDGDKNQDKEDIEKSNFDSLINVELCRLKKVLYKEIVNKIKEESLSSGMVRN